MVTPLWVPDRGDAVWLAFDPQAGLEPSGRRPAPVLSPALYNEKAGLAVLCPITSRGKGYPFEVDLPAGSALEGVVLADQVKSLDWRARGAALIERLPEAVTAEVLAKLSSLLA